MFKLPLFIFPIWLEVRKATAQTSFNQSSHLNQYCLQHTVQLLIRLFISFILFFLLLILMLALSAVHDFDYHYLNQLMFIVC